MAEYEDVIKEIDVLSCCLIGEYGENGEYKIDAELKQNLIDCTKLVTSYTLEALECHAQIGEYVANFKIKFVTSDDDTLKYAGMYLVENYKLLGKPYTVETFLAKYSDYNDHDYLTKLREVFNITTKDESEGKDIKNSIPLYEDLKKQKSAYYKDIVSGLSDVNKRYVMEVLAILKPSDKLGAEVRKQFKPVLANIKLEKNSPAYWAKLKASLDEIIEANKEKYKEEAEDLLKEINKRYVMLYKKVQKAAKKKAQKLLAKKKKEAAKKEADEYTPYYPTANIGPIDLKPLEKPKTVEPEKTAPKVSQKAPLPVEHHEKKVEKEKERDKERERTATPPINLEGLAEKASSNVLEEFMGKDGPEVDFAKEFTNPDPVVEDLGRELT